MRFSIRVLLFLRFAALPIALSFALSAAAQSQTARISGVVTDPQGSAVVDAQVSTEAIPSAGPAARGVSASDGRFSLTLPPGRYRLAIAHDAFATDDQEITVAAGETRELQVRLALEPLSSKVVVTAQTLPLSAESSPAPVTILTRQQIDQRVATSLPDLLETQPGFSLGRTGPEGGSASLFLDGGNSNYTKVLVDGVPANTPGGLIDFSNFTLDNIDKIEIVHGAESALYGSDAMDGVIQIFTRRGTTRIPEFTAFTDGGNFATGHGGAELSGLLEGSIIPPLPRISKHPARARTMRSAIARSLEISAGDFPTTRGSVFPCAITTAKRALPGRRSCSLPTLPTRSRYRTSRPACTRNS